MLTANDKRHRRVMTEALMEKIQVNKSFLSYFITSDEVHFHLDSTQSPDLSPPDFFLWGYLKDRVYQEKPRTLADLKKKIQDERKAICTRTTSVRLKLSNCSCNHYQIVFPVVIKV